MSIAEQTGFVLGWLYRGADEARAVLAVEAAWEATRLGYNLFVVDGGSPQQFVDRMVEAGATVVAEVSHEQGVLGVGRRQALQLAAASGADVIIWSELEKGLALFSELDEAIETVRSGRASMVIPSRTDDLASYPPEQRLAEKLGNLAVEYLLGYPLDFWFGPFVAGLEALRFFLDYDPATFGLPDKWDAIHAPRLQVIAAGLTVVSVPVDYTHPAVQTNEETGDLGMLMKRVEQLLNLVPAFRQLAEKLGLYPHA